MLMIAVGGSVISARNAVRTRDLRETSMADTYQGDPYREVEMYLEQAQEEIGRAFADLARYEFRFDSSTNSSTFSSPALGSGVGSSHCSPVATIKVNVGDNGMIDKSKLCRGGNNLSPTSSSSLMEDLSTPPTGDLEQLSAWADTFVQEVNLEWESTGPWDTNVDEESENFYLHKFRSLPTTKKNHQRNVISTSFRSGVSTTKRNGRRHCDNTTRRKLWSWPPGLEVDLDTGKITIYPLRVKDAEVQTGLGLSELTGKLHDVVNGSDARASFQVTESATLIPNPGSDETNRELSSSPSLQRKEEDGEEVEKEREKPARRFESSSNWIFKNMLSREADAASSIDRCSSSSDSDCDSLVVASGVEETNRENPELSESLDIDEVDGASDVSSDNEDENDQLMGSGNSFATSTNGAVSFTVSWLAVEDDSDHLENKELPKLTSKNLLDANYGGTEGTPQKSPSSTLSSVSRHELETFLQKVASSVYQPPPEGAAGLSDSPQQDAVTQTSPNLSRSSSFTWVTDCDCSDLSPRPQTGPSRDSLPSFSDCPTSDSRDTSSTASSSSFTEKDLKSSTSSSSRTGSPRYRKPTPKIQPWFDSSLSLSDASDLNSDPGGQHFDFEQSNGHHPRGQHDSGGSDPSSSSSRKFGGKWLRLADAQALSPEFKSSSAPLVMGKSDTSPTNKAGPNFDLKVLMTAQRSQSARQLTELEAIEACTWLRAAGFPQYAQMYEDNLFPIDITGVRKDHEFLDSDAIRSLFRRLNTLNKCARLKSDGFPRKSIDESDEEDHCALSENWQFQRSSRRWSRILPLSPTGFNNTSGGPVSPKAVCGSPKFLSPNSANLNNCNRTSPSYDNSRDSVFLDDPLLQSSPESLRKAEFFITMGLPMEEDFANYLGGGLRIPPGSPVPGSIMDRSEHSSLRRSGSERLKDSARALLRRVESLKGKRKKKNREVVIIGGPEGDTSATMVTSSKSEVIDSNGIEIGVESDTSLTGTPQIKHSRKGWPFPDDTSAHSDSECPIQLTVEVPTTNDRLIKIRNGSVSSLDDVSPGSQDSARSRRGGQRNSQWLGISEMVRSPGDRRSLYDNVPPSSVKSSVETTPDLSLPSYTRSNSCKDSEHDSAVYNHVGGSDAETPGSQEDMDISGITSERRDSGVGSSLTRQSGLVIQPRWHCFTSTTLQLPAPRSGAAQHVLVNSLSAPQLMVLRKFSLLKLTALMEKYSPSNRAGWNWGVPKFIRRIRTPDYKDKLVFGVPLILVVQRTGQPLPPSIQIAIEFIRKNGLDATGVFRKSGVRSRIQKLRNLCESNPEGVSFEGQQVYDVADMIKQYFRELPDALLTNKLSETFISIFQHIPSELRLEATQAAILLMPDENREALQSLLCFLDEVCDHSEENQMTATNLAVCFAPSLFHLNVPRSASASPRRRKTVGVPDQKDLNENRAAHECLTTMVSNYKRLFLVPEDTMIQCRLLSSVETCEPVNLADLIKSEGTGGGILQDGWKAYMDGCIEGLLKEAREKFKGWVPLPSVDGVDVAYKKVGDGHPLKLWKVSVEIEAPPVELLNRVLRERHIWDEKLLKWKVVVKLDKQAEIYQHTSGTITPHPPRDYSVLRMWRIDPKKGTTCILVETSVEHTDAVVPSNAIRGLVLASRFLIEACGSGKSKVTHITRIDTRGRAPEWYNKVYGQYCATLLVKLRDSFKQAAAGPETKV